MVKKMVKDVKTEIAVQVLDELMRDFNYYLNQARENLDTLLENDPSNSNIGQIAGGCNTMVHVIRKINQYKKNLLAGSK